MTEADVSFEHDSTFEQGQAAGNIRLGEFESHYQEIFAEVIEDGVITAEERARLDHAAENLGLDKTRLAKLEEALRVAYETSHHIRILDQGGKPAAPGALHAGPAGEHHFAPDASNEDLRAHISMLETRIAQLERELTEAHAQVDIQIDVTEIDRASASTSDEITRTMRRLRDNPRDIESLRQLHAIHLAAGDNDRRWCFAHALSFLGAASGEEDTFYRLNKPAGLIRPTKSLSQEAWQRLLTHPDEEVVIGQIFSVITSAILVGRLSALRRDGALPALDPARKQDPTVSTIQAVRCFAWAASILGITAPPLFADPEFERGAMMVPGFPPATRLGSLVLSGRSPTELAFVASHHLAWYREERFVRLLVPGVDDLESLFLTALFIANPSIPMTPAMKARVTPLAAAIEPVLEPTMIDRLRACFMRFVEEGGRTNLQRWATAADLTAARAGLLLCNDLFAAEAMLKAEASSDPSAAMDALLLFAISDHYTQLRQALGIALPT